MTASKIEWTDRSDWNPIRGCTRVSPGCGGPGPHGGCYAEAIAGRFSDPGQPFHGFAERTSKGARWTGKVAVQWDRLDLPIRWQKPAAIFASSTSDFFHPGFSFDEIAQLFGVMIAAHHYRGHTFQVLTKRSEIMRKTLAMEAFWDVANSAAEGYIIERVDPLNRRSDDARATCEVYGPDKPPPGIWLGVSVEDQTRADERIPDLLATPAAIRFLSCEPLLGPLDIAWALGDPIEIAAGFLARGHFSPGLETLRGIDWIIAGGESGPGARAMHPDWVRSLRDQCAAADVPFHFKQWGEWLPSTDPEVGARLGAEFRNVNRTGFLDAYTIGINRIGKARAGRMLDGIEHNGVPG